VSQDETLLPLLPLLEKIVGLSKQLLAGLEQAASSWPGEMLIGGVLLSLVRCISHLFLM
jgi:hypothetical protein